MIISKNADNERFKENELFSLIFKEKALKEKQRQGGEKINLKIFNGIQSRYEKDAVLNIILILTYHKLYLFSEVCPMLRAISFMGRQIYIMS